MTLIEDALAKGAQLVCRGSLSQAALAPTVLTGASGAMTVMRREAFGAVQVDLDDAAPLVGGIGVEWGVAAGNASRIDENRDWTDFRFDLAMGSRQSVEIGDVDLLGGSCGAQRRPRLLQFVCVAIPEADAPARGNEPPGDGEAQPWAPPVTTAT